MSLNKILSLLMIVLIITAAAPAVFAQNDISVEVSSVLLLDSDGSPLGSCPKSGETVTYGYCVNNYGAALICNVICAFYNNGNLVYAFNGDKTSLEAEKEGQTVTVTFSLPDFSDGENWTMKCFLWGADDNCPLAKSAFCNISETRADRYGDSWLSPELIKNSSFEKDNYVTGDWNIRVGGKLQRCSSEKADGNYSCRIYERKNGYCGIRQDMTEQLKKYGSGKYIFKISQMYPSYSSDTYLCCHIVLVAKDGTSTTVDYLPPIKDKDWSAYERESSITVNDDLDNAYIYIETIGSEKGDLYIDACSLKKVVSAYEYYTPLLDGYINSDNDININADGRRVSYPCQSDEVLINPYNGLVIYPEAGLLFDESKVFKDDENYKGAMDLSSVVYKRYSWSMLEPNEGEYKWDSIEKNIEMCRKHGKMFAIGLGYLVNVNGTSNYEESCTPDWLFEAGAEYVTEEMSGGKTVKVPVFNDPVFLKKYGEFIESFAKRFNGNDNIAYVDMRSFGNWGEWHLNNLPNSAEKATEYSEDDYRALVDIWEPVKLPLMMFGTQLDAKNYAYDTYSTGLRLDGTMNPNELWKNKRLAEQNGIAPTVSEWYANPSVYTSDGGAYSDMKPYLETFYERVVTEGKTSYTALGYFQPEDFYKDYSDICKRLANKVGYWFKPVKIVYPKSITDGRFDMLIKNDGVTRLYAKDSCVRLALANESGEVIDTVTLNADPQSWKAGAYSLVSCEYSFSNTEGAAKLLLGVFSSKEKTEPDIKFGIKGGEDGWYNISDGLMADKLSDNRIYTSKELYADTYYGFRRPEHAFDGDAATYWANECCEGNYLEIDFGETVTANSFTVTAAEDVSVDYSVCVYDKNTWKTVGTGSCLTTQGTSFDYYASGITKARLVINGTSSSVVKISSFDIE